LPVEATGSTISLGLFAAKPTDPADPSVAGGTGTVASGVVTVPLYASDSGNLWTGTSSFFIAFNTEDGEAYVSKSAKSFSGNVSMWLAEFDKASPGGDGSGGSITFTGIDPQYNGQYASFRSSAGTPPAGGDYLFGGNSISATGITGVQIRGGSLTIPVQLVDEEPYSAAPYTGSDKNIRIYLMIKSSASFTFDDLWADEYQKHTINSVTFTNGSASTGIGISGALTITGGFSDNFMVYIVATAITDSNLMTVMETPVAGGWGVGSPAELEWSPGYGNGTYNVIIMSEAGGGSVKYQNGVSFANGSGSVNWGSMTEVDPASLGVGTLTFTGSSPGEGWMVYIVPGPLTGDGWEGEESIDHYVAMAPGSAGGMIFTIGAPGGTFNRNGTYAIIYEDDDKEFKYLNNVTFSNGNAAINLSLLIDFDYSQNTGPIEDGPGEGGGPSTPVAGKTVTITGLSAYDGAKFIIDLFATKPTVDQWHVLEPSPEGGGTGNVQNGSVRVDLYYGNSPWTRTGDWYIAFNDYDNEEIYYVTITSKSFSDNNINVMFSEFEKIVNIDDLKPGEDNPGEGEEPGETKPGENEPGGDNPGGTKPGENEPGEDNPGETKPGEDNPGEELTGTLAVNGLSGEFIVYVVRDTITDDNLATVMGSAVVAAGKADGFPATLRWYSGDGSGTYGILIASRAGGGSIRFQNNVSFDKGSGSLNWGSMTEVDPASLSVGTLAINGSLGTDWMVFIVNGPLAGDIGAIWSAMDAYVAMTPGYAGGSGWMIFTIGAEGGPFNPDGNYSIIYAEDEVLKYQDHVSFSEGNATINLSSMLDPDFGETGGGEGGGGYVDPVDPPGIGGEGGFGGIVPAQSLFRFAW
jgi:hypothetical protein